MLRLRWWGGAGRGLTILANENSSLVLPESALTDETREELRRLARREAYFMGKAVIGFKDMTPKLHRQMGEWISDGEPRKMGLVPRDHLKTSIWTIADSVRRIANDRNIRILLGNETATNAQHFLRRIEVVFERNALFQWLFPECIPDFAKVKKWSETEMVVPREVENPESTVEAIGVGGAVVSRHYELLKLDDLVGKEASESADVMRKTVDWYQYCESLLVSPKNEIHVFGTRWTFNDLYSWIQEREGDYISSFFRRCYDQSGQPIWPERFDEESLARIKRKLGTFKFNCQYLNEPFDPESASFHESWLRYYSYIGGGDGVDRNILPESGSGFRVGDLRRFMRVDPAISERPGAARSAIIVDGVHQDSRKFLLEAWAKRCQPFEMIEQIFEFQDQYDCESIGFESVAYQRILKPILEAEAERRGKWLNVVELKPDSRERKENRIRGVQPELERGNIWVRRDLEDFLDEYRSFPVGKTVDLLDAWAYGPHVWAEPVIEENLAHEIQEFEYFGGRSSVTGY